MRRIFSVALVLSLVAGTCPASLYSDAWIRGASSVALNDDATALFVNPAGLAMYDETSTYASLSKSGSDVAGGALAFKFGSLGIGYTRQYLWDVSDSDRDPGLELSDHAVDTYMLGLALGDTRKFGLAFDYRWFRPQFGEREKTGTWDVGIMYRPTEFLSVGAAVRNLSETGLPAGEGRSGRDATGSCPCDGRMSYVAGVAVRPIGNRLTLMADAVLPRDDDVEDAILLGGLEAEIMDGLVLRGSIQTYPSGDEREQETSFGLYLNTSHLAAGASVRSFDAGGDDILTYAAMTTGERMRTEISPGDRIAEIKVAGPLSDMPARWSFFGQPTRSAQSIVGRIRKVSRDSSISCILLRIHGLGNPFLGGASALVQEIRDEVVRAREDHGKKVVAFLEYEAGTQEYFLATAADEIVLNPSGGIDGIGNYVNVMRYTGTTEKVGIEWDYMAAGKYKSSFHSLGAGPMTDEQREEVQSLVDDNYDVIIDAVMAGRGYSRSEAEALCDGRLFMPVQALEAGLVDRLAYDEGAKAAALELMGHDAPEEPENISTVNVSKWRDKAYDWTYGPKIAVIGAYGGIEVGKSDHDPIMGGGSIGSETLIAELRRVRKDPSVKAVILRVDSGGGSGLASEMIWHETVKLAREKPFIASMADVAASGGYAISMKAEKIFVEPLTITGSIGVVGMKPVLAELYRKIDATHETFKSGEHADQWSSSRHLTEEELAMAEEAIGIFYDGFLEKVADGRNMPIERVRELAEGRVYTGTQALEVGLVDEMGGLSEAIDYACERIGVAREDATIVWYRKGASWQDKLFEKAAARLGLYRFLGFDESGLEDLLSLRAQRGLLQK
jgi:protease-4